MDKKTIIIIILLGIIFVGGCYFIGNYVRQEAYQQGLNDGAYTIIQKINADGKIPIITENQTINYMPIQTICGILG